MISVPSAPSALGGGGPQSWIPLKKELKLRRRHLRVR